MKYFIIISLLITVSSQAQEEQQQDQNEVKVKTQKRPSWSQGLPERQSPINPMASMSSLKANKNRVNTTDNDRSLEVAELPGVEIDVVKSQPIIELEIEPAKPVASSRQQAFEQYHSGEKSNVSETTVNPLFAQYKWTPIKTTPIDVPNNFGNNETLKLNIYINPKGEVTRVTVAETSIPRKVFKSAEKSILKWKFQAPAEIGITEDISKTFSIDIKTDA